MNTLLELQQINHITCLEQELIMDYSKFAFTDQKCGTLAKNIKLYSLKGFKDNQKKNF